MKKMLKTLFVLPEFDEAWKNMFFIMRDFSWKTQKSLHLPYIVWKKGVEPLYLPAGNEMKRKSYPTKLKTGGIAAEILTAPFLETRTCLEGG